MKVTEMEKINYKEKYSIFSKEYSKSKIDFKQLDDISKYFIKKIEIHEFAEYIGIFDHYGHTSNINTGIIYNEIIRAKNILFCFGKKLLEPKIL